MRVRRRVLPRLDCWSAKVKGRDVLETHPVCVAGRLRGWWFRVGGSFGEEDGVLGKETVMSIEAIIGYLFAAFSLGYCAGASIRNVRKAIESLD